MRKCKYCGKELKRKRFKRSDAVGYKYYTPNGFCNRSHTSLYYWDEKRKWSKKKLKREFNKIKDERRWSSGHMNRNYRYLIGSIRYYWRGNNYWHKFLTEEYDREPVRNFINPKSKVAAKEIMKLLRSLYEVGDIFCISHEEFSEQENYRMIKAPVEKKVEERWENINPPEYRLEKTNPYGELLAKEVKNKKHTAFRNGIRFLKERGCIQLIEQQPIGSSFSMGITGDSQYKLLKTRI